MTVAALALGPIQMSYNPYYSEPASTPTTPNPNIYPWDPQQSSQATSPVEQQGPPQPPQQQPQNQPQPQHQHQQHPHTPQTSDINAPFPPPHSHSTGYTPLPPPERMVPSQRQQGHSIEPVRLRTLEGSSTSPSGVGPVRTSPQSLPHHSFPHPYRRPPHPRLGTSREQESHVRFAPPAGTPPAGPSTPAQRIASLASSVTSSSPIASAGPSTLPPPNANISSPSPSARRFIIRTDVLYDAESKMLTALLELPGVRRSDLRVTLSTCVLNRVRQVVVAGTSKPPFPESAFAVKERKFGEFTRTLVVPSETKVEDVSAEMEDGILILRIYLGPPAESESAQEVTVR